MMIANLKPYTEYKESQSPWMGQVPRHWDVKPLRAMLKQRNEKNSPIKTTQILSLSIAHGVTLYSHEGRGGNKAKSDLSAYKVAHVGDIVLNSMNVIVGAVGLSKYKGAISPVYYALYPRSEGVAINYFDKIFSNSIFQRYLLIYGKGILIKESESGKLNTIRMKISPEDLKGTVLPLPPREEQLAIVQFLNYAIRRLERTIQAKRKMIALLNEQKQAIIHRAVTRGLDPNVKLKPSGIPWLGDIPVHWEVVRACRLFKQVLRYTSRGDEPKMSMSRRYGLIRSERLSNRAAQAATSITFSVCEPGDLVLNKYQAHNGLFGAAVERGLITSNYSVFEPIGNAFAEFYSHLFASPSYRTEFRMRCQGVGDGMMPLYSSAFLKTPAVAPAPKEQRRIVAFITDATKEIAEANLRLEREIELLREYRTRLVADVVTGKVDVREAAAKLPDETSTKAAEPIEDFDEEVETADEEATA